MSFALGASPGAALESGSVGWVAPASQSLLDTPSPTWQAPSMVGRLVIASILLEFTIAVALYWPAAFLFPLNFGVPALLVYLVYSRWLRPAAAVPADSPVGATDDLALRFFGGMWWPGLFIAFCMNTFVSIALQGILLRTIDWAVALQGDDVDINDSSKRASQPASFCMNS